MTTHKVYKSGKFYLFLVLVILTRITTRNHSHAMMNLHQSGTLHHDTFTFTVPCSFLSHLPFQEYDLLEIDKMNIHEYPTVLLQTSFSLGDRLLFDAIWTLNTYLHRLHLHHFILIAFHGLCLPPGLLLTPSIEHTVFLQGMVGINICPIWVFPKIGVPQMDGL